MQLRVKKYQLVWVTEIQGAKDSFLTQHHRAPCRHCSPPSHCKSFLSESLDSRQFKRFTTKQSGHWLPDSTCPVLCSIQSRSSILFLNSRHRRWAYSQPHMPYSQYRSPRLRECPHRGWENFLAGEQRDGERGAPRLEESGPRGVGTASCEAPTTRYYER